MTQQAVRTAMVMTVRERVAAADVNAGATLAAAVKGMAHRLVDFTMIAIGGAAGTTTTVDILGTQSAASAKLAAVGIAALTEDAIVKPDTGNVTMLAAGASYVANDENTAITIGVTGDDLDTATHIDVLLSYVTEEA
jgi:7-cyano-7-deazaguanine synthase in queuosine biosynthesis